MLQQHATALIDVIASHQHDPRVAHLGTRITPPVPTAMALIDIASDVMRANR